MLFTIDQKHKDQQKDKMSKKITENNDSLDSARRALMGRTSATKRAYRNHDCNVIPKLSFDSRGEAERYRKDTSGPDNLEVFKCGDCGKWHLCFVGFRSKAAGKAGE